MKPKTREQISNYLLEMADVARLNIEKRWKVKGDVSVQFEPKRDEEKISVSSIYT